MQVEQETEKGMLLFVKVPDDADVTYLATVNDKNVVVFNNDDNRVRTYDIPDGFEYISLTSEVTEFECINMGYDIFELDELQKKSKGKWIILFKPNEKN